MDGDGDLSAENRMYFYDDVYFHFPVTFVDDIEIGNNDRLEFEASDGTKGAEIFCYTNDNLVIDNESTGQFIKLRTEGNDSQVLVLDDDGQVGIGTDTPGYALEARDNRNGSAVAYIINESTGTNAEGLRIKLNSNDPGSDNEFITFFDSGTVVGRIEGDGIGGVTYASGYMDLAEWMPRINKEEKIKAGDIVGVVSGMVGRDTSHADQFMVVSTAPAFLGNTPAKKEENAWEKIAFMGRLPVRVCGPVDIGDFIVPSGKSDGTGIAVSPENLSIEHATRIAGRAWESSDEPEVKLVECAVGLRAGNQALSRILRKKDREVAFLKDNLLALEKRIAALESAD